MMEHYNEHPPYQLIDTEAERATYCHLDALGITYETLRHEAVYTMADCEKVNNELGVCACKNLFLCNRQQTEFFLLMLPADKTFKTLWLTPQLGCSRLSFASEKHMLDKLGLHPAAVSPLGLINDLDGQVQLLVDKDLLYSEWVACHPCVNTATVKLLMSDLLVRILPATGHCCRIIELRNKVPSG